MCSSDEEERHTAGRKHRFARDDGSCSATNTDLLQVIASSSSFRNSAPLVKKVQVALGSVLRTKSKEEIYGMLW